MRFFLRSILIVLAVVTGLYFLAAPFVMPKVIERAVRQAFTESAHGQLSLGTITFNPFLLRAGFSDVSIDDAEGRRVLALNRLMIDLGWRTLWGSKLVIDHLALDQPTVVLAFDETGTASVVAMIKTSDPSTAAGVGQRALSVGGLAVSGADITYTDHAGYRTRAKGIDLSLGPFETEGLGSMTLSAFKADYAGGTVMVEGTVTPQPFSVDLALQLDSVSAADAIGFIDLGTFHPIDAQASGSVRLRLGQDTEVEATLALRDVVLAGDELLPALAADAVVIDTLHYREADDSLKIAALSLTRPVATLVRPRPTESASGEEAVRQLVTRIDRLRVEGGTLTFLDEKVGADPLPLQSLNGTFEDIEIGHVVASRFDFDARIDGVSPVTADGAFSLGSYLDADARLVVDRLDHRWLRPYAVSLLGRPSEGGTAHLEFDYDVEIDEIDGLNTMVFNNWQWGDRDPGYDGDPPPVTKAFNMLETSRGQVHLVVPVEGDVSDPTFKVDALVKRATNKVITGIVAAPFKLIGRIVGGSKDALDFDKYEFEASSAELTALHKSQLSLLAEALKERPKLTLEIDGVAVPGVDLAKAGADPEAPVDTAGLKKLANQRADAVYQYLIANGVSADRLTRGTRPIGDKKTPSVRMDINR